jgi:hypothetical protein
VKDVNNSFLLKKQEQRSNELQTDNIGGGLKTRYDSVKEPKNKNHA